MIHEIYPDYFESSDRIREWKRQLAQKATKIIAISENTRQDIIRFYNIDPEKIEVTHLASSLKAEPPLEKNGHVQPVLSYPYLLFVGKRKLYKNFDFFISSAAPLLKQYPNLKVVCTGGEPISNEERQTFSTLGITGRVIQIFPDDAALGKLYLDAIALVFPSLYEGFGIPVLEAFNCGCPVIASNASSLPEIGGDAALYFNPGDSSSILEALDIIVEDQEIRNECIKRGYQRAKEFSWEKTAKLTERVYKGAI
jgi:glycosyltransferase involved in cell wall biosynthesis